MARATARGATSVVPPPTPAEGAGPGAARADRGSNASSIVIGGDAMAAERAGATRRGRSSSNAAGRLPADAAATSVPHAMQVGPSVRGAPQAGHEAIADDDTPIDRPCYCAGRMSKRLDFLLKVTAGSEDPFAWYGLAMEYRSLGRLDEALAAFERLRAKTPEYVPMYLMCGQVLEKLGRTDEARAWFYAGIDAARTKGDAHAASELEGALEALS
jgi:tetratricopeptide (TPR) repeat protein